MTNAILQAYKDVEAAVERYTKLLQDQVVVLQNTEQPGSD